MSAVLYAIAAVLTFLGFVVVISLVHERGHARVAKRLNPDADVVITVGSRPFVKLPEGALNAIGLRGVDTWVGLSVKGVGSCDHTDLGVSERQLVRFYMAGIWATVGLALASIPVSVVVFVVLAATGLRGGPQYFVVLAEMFVLVVSRLSAVTNLVCRSEPTETKHGTDAYYLDRFRRAAPAAPPVVHASTASPSDVRRRNEAGRRDGAGY